MGQSTTFGDHKMHFRHSVKGGNRNSLQYKRNIAAIGTFKVCSNKCGVVKKYNKVSRKND